MELKKELNLLDVFCISTGAMISSGLFVLPGLAHAKAGPAAFVAYILAGILALPGLFSQAELVSAMPRAGGDYFYITRSLGPAVGTVSGLITWFSLSLKSAFALVGMAAFTKLLIDLNMHLIAAAFCAFFILLNLIGIKEAGRFQVALVLFLLSGLIYYIARGLPSIKIMNLEPFAPNGIAAIFSTAGFVFISFGGLLKVTSIAEEVKDPGRTVPLGMILSLLIVSILYMLVVLVTTGVLDGVKLDNSLTPITDGAAAFLGKPGQIIMSVAAALAFITTANAGMMAASRYPMALSRDNLLPEPLSKINRHFKTPHFSILVTGGFMIVALFLPLDILVKAASTVLLLTFIFCCVSVLILRESRLQNYQPRFKTPIYPVPQIIGIIAFGFLIFEMGTTALAIALVLIIAGVFVYWFYGRIQATREYALLYLIERVTAQELVTGTLERELKEIIRERDDIEKDRFDRLIEKSTILDIKEAMPSEDFFEIAAKELSKELDVNEEVIFNKLIDREKETTTAISPGLAIPHIVVNGEKKFTILLARCREGIVFSDGTDKVHALFVLAGTKDERTFHLRALAAIAQIVQDPNFEKKWLEAKNKQALRDIVLLGKRRRHK